MAYFNDHLTKTNMMRHAHIMSRCQLKCYMTLSKCFNQTMPGLSGLTFFNEIRLYSSLVHNKKQCNYRANEDNC